MRACNPFDREYRRHWLIILSCFGVASATIAAHSADRQISESSTSLTWKTADMPPRVPLMESRPQTGDRPEEQWKLDRSGDDAAPLTGFIDSLQGQDAVIQIPLGEARLLTTKAPIVEKEGVGFIALGDPTIADFEVLPNPRMIRLTGRRPGTTDLSFVTAGDQSYSFQLQVVYDLDVIQAKLLHAYPGASIQLSQLRDHVVLRGLARDSRQLTQIEATLAQYLTALVTSTSTGSGPRTASPIEDGLPSESDFLRDSESLKLRSEFEQRTFVGGRTSPFAPQIINLMTVPGVQQVLLQVRIAELNRTGMRRIGADSFFEFGSGNILGTQIAGANVSLNRGTDVSNLTPGTATTAFGVFPTARMEIMLAALRDNALVRVLAEPNLVALSGHEASFLAGGEFPVPISQGGLNSNSVTVQFKEFGVQLNFVPHILDEDQIRLEVRPEVSTIDQSLGTTLVVGGDPIPGVNTRRVHTTVKLREGETLALAGLLQVTIDARTSRVPGLGDLPYLGPFFGNTSHESVEKELLVLVTPFLVSPLAPEEVPALPGSEIQEPNDLEFFLLSRIEGRTGRPFRSTLSWDDPLDLVRKLKLERDHVCGPAGFTR